MKYSVASLLTMLMTAGFAAAQSCDTNKYCAYSYNNNNCAITTWDCDDCEVVVFNECTADAGCGGGASCINNLCCHADKLANGSSDCPTTDDLKACGGYTRSVGTGSAAAWVPPHTSIPDNLKCGC